MSRCISLDFQVKKRSFLAGAGFSLALFSWAALGVDGAGAQGLGVDHALEYGACLELTGSDPEQALESARIWSEAAGGDAAEHCVAAALIGLGVGGLHLLVRLAWADYGREHLGAIRGLTLSAQIGGQALGPVVAGFLFDANQNYQAAFLVFATAVSLGGLLVLAAVPPRMPGRALQADAQS